MFHFWTNFRCRFLAKVFERGSAAHNCYKSHCRSLRLRVVSARALVARSIPSRKHRWQCHSRGTLPHAHRTHSQQQITLCSEHYNRCGHAPARRTPALRHSCHCRYHSAGTRALFGKHLPAARAQFYLPMNLTRVYQPAGRSPSALHTARTTCDAPDPPRGARIRATAAARRQALAIA